MTTASLPLRDFLLAPEGAMVLRILWSIDCLNDFEKAMLRAALEESGLLLVVTGRD